MKITDILGFDREKKAFELYERETGTPDPFAPWRDADGKSEEEPPFPNSVREAYELFEKSFNTDKNKDLILRRFLAGGRRGALAVYMNGMADDTKVNDFILRPLMTFDGASISLDELLKKTVRIGEVRRESSVKNVFLAVMDGMTALFLDGEREAAILETHGYEKRGIDAPENEKVVTGAKESFTESLRTNITLVRRLIHERDLVVETELTGGGGNTRLAIVYRDGVTNEALIGEVKRRLARIKTGGILTSGMLGQMIEDDKNSPLPQILSTERPDRAASHVMQGSVCLLVEGSPFALLMPVTFFSLMSSPEDVYLRKPLGTMLRLVRYFGAAASVLLPGYFLSLALYHQGILSTEVLSTVMASRMMVFEPIGVEMLLLLFIFQLIREAGQRVPGNIGQAIGIIGGLVMGQAAVTAHLASPVVLIIVAASGLGNFCIPDYSTQLAASYLRIAVVIAAWLGGLLGIAAAVLAAACHIAGLKSFGVPFLAPFAPRTSRKRPIVLRGDIGMHERPEDMMNTSFDGRLEDGE
ncbi:MAG: spore germination protein [Clostridiales bacterium]|nr:spore germination protein [Clostridiales bacterium]